MNEKEEEKYLQENEEDKRKIIISLLANTKNKHIAILDNNDDIKNIYKSFSLEINKDEKILEKKLEEINKEYEKQNITIEDNIKEMINKKDEEKILEAEENSILAVLVSIQYQLEIIKIYENKKDDFKIVFIDEDNVSVIKCWSVNKDTEQYKSISSLMSDMNAKGQTVIEAYNQYK